MGNLERELLIGVDSFNKPKVIKGKDAIGILLVRLIRLEPGTFPSRPEMGVGLLSNYRYCDENKAIALQEHIKEQIRIYLPEYQGVRVETKLNPKGTLLINITIDKVMYKYETEIDTENNKIIGIHSVM